MASDIKVMDQAEGGQQATKLVQLFVEADGATERKRLGRCSCPWGPTCGSVRVQRTAVYHPGLKTCSRSLMSAS